MTTRLTQFLKAESGAVTVDWTVLTAGIVGLGLASIGAVRTGVGSLGTEIGNSLSNASVVSLGDLSGAAEATGFSPFSMTAAELEAAIAAANLHDDAFLDLWYGHWASQALLALNTNNLAGAADFIDQAYAHQQVMIDRGMTLRTGDLALDHLISKYEFMTGG